MNLGYNGIYISFGGDIIRKIGYRRIKGIVSEVVYLGCRIKCYMI